MSVKDAVERITALIRNWAGHVARDKDGKWTKKILEWRRSDDIKRIQENKIPGAQNRKHLNDLWPMSSSELKTDINDDDKYEIFKLLEKIIRVNYGLIIIGQNISVVYFSMLCSADNLF